MPNSLKTIQWGKYKSLLATKIDQNHFSDEFTRVLTICSFIVNWFQIFKAGFRTLWKYFFSCSTLLEEMNLFLVIMLDIVRPLNRFWPISRRWHILEVVVEHCRREYATFRHDFFNLLFCLVSIVLLGSYYKTSTYL